MNYKPLIYSKRSPTIIRTIRKVKKNPTILAGPRPQTITESIDLDRHFGVRFSNSARHDRFDYYDPIVIIGGDIVSAFSEHTNNTRTEEVGRVEREVFKSLKCGKTVCLLFEIDEISSKILTRAKIGFDTLSGPNVDLIPCQSDFNNLITNFGSTQYTFNGDFEKTLCKTSEGEIAGFSKKVHKGTLLYIPCYMTLSNFLKESTFCEFLPQLLNSLKKFQLRVQYETPDWVNAYHFQKELPIVNKVSALQKKLNRNFAILEDYKKIKEVLWFRDDALIRPIINLFHSIGLDCQSDEQFKEDFWVLRDKKQEIIVEVKALDKNIKRHHVSQLDMHRGSRDKPDDFPAVLIVNSFNEAKSLKAKDKPISPAEIKKAVQLKILIVRTLDLCNAFSLIEAGNLISDNLFKILKTEHGWLNVTSEGFEIIKQ